MLLSSYPSLITILSGLAKRHRKQHDDVTVREIMMMTAPSIIITASYVRENYCV